MTYNRSHNRHLRHGRFSRVRHRRQLISWLATQSARLTSTETPITISAQSVAGAKASQTLTGSANFTANDTVTIGSKTYTFKSSVSVDGDVLLDGSTLATTLSNLAAAINLGPGKGTAYATAMTANSAGVSATSDSTHVVVTATAIGTAGNSIATTASIASAHGSWGNTTLLGGVNTALTAAWTATSHGLNSYSGPFLLSDSGGSLPSNVSGTSEVFAFVVDANTLKLGLSKSALSKGVFIVPNGPGTGTISLKRDGGTNQGIYELLRRNTADAVMKASDIDNLK